MKIAVIILFSLAVAFMGILFALGIVSKSGKPPGLIGGVLAQCSSKPNCVCSEQTGSASHTIDPINLSGQKGSDYMPIIKDVIRDMGGQINDESAGYLSSTFSSSLFGFVDDFEISIDENKRLIHIRSASRVGYSDAGVNRKRVESFKRLYENKILQEIE